MSDKFLLMYDATPGGVDSIPSDAQAVAGYVDGHYQSFPLLVHRFYPHAHIVSIGVFLGHLAAFTDVEPGNPIKTPELVRADFEHRKAHGVWRPGYYADKTRMENTILPGLSGIPREEFRLWVAEWDGHAVVPLGYDAKQFTNNPRQGREGAYDTSIVDIQRFFPAGKHRALPKPKLHKPKLPHPKVVGAGAAGAITTGILAILHASGVHHITPAESSAAASLAAIVAGYLTPARKGN